MPITIDTNTLLPMGFVLTIAGGIWYMSGKMKTLSNIEAFMSDAKKSAMEVLRRTDFEKHITEDSAFHLSIEKRLTELERGQVRTDEKLGNIERSLIIIQSDVKKVLEK